MFIKEQAPKSFEYVNKRVYKTLRCNRCGSIVLKSDLPQYSYQCLNCDEDLFKIEVHRGEKIKPYEFDDLCEVARDILLLDD